MLYEANEIPVVKDGSKKLPVEELVVDNYDVHRRYGTDWVTEYNYVSSKSMSVEEFQQFLKDQGNPAYGELTFKKKKLTFADGKIYYLHNCKAVMY